MNNAPQSEQRYGNPYKFVEFRMMILNNCSMDCRGCFYKKTDNNFNDFSSALKFAKDLINNDYRLAVCYLLPTDIFDNPDNYNLLLNEDFRETLKLFSYVGIASTIETEFDHAFFEIIDGISKDLKIELQINLLIAKLFDVNYQIILKSRIKNIKEKYGDRILINLAINTGFKISEKEKEKLKNMLSFLSDDELIELNFTFLYNKEINKEKKKKMLEESIKIANELSDYYAKNADFIKTYDNNDRTLMRKPAFSFVGNPNRIYLNLIVPFDEDVYIEDDKFLIKDSSYDSFLNTYGQLEDINKPILDECNNCNNLSRCLGKGYFIIANEFDLNCFMHIR
jgi:hypothetical protein